MSMLHLYVWVFLSRKSVAPLESNLYPISYKHYHATPIGFMYGNMYLHLPYKDQPNVGQKKKTNLDPMGLIRQFLLTQQRDWISDLEFPVDMALLAGDSSMQLGQQEWGTESLEAVYIHCHKIHLWRVHVHMSTVLVLAEWRFLSVKTANTHVINCNYSRSCGRWQLTI